MEVDFLKFLSIFMRFFDFCWRFGFFRHFFSRQFSLEYASLRMPHFIIQMFTKKMQNYKIKWNLFLMHVCPFSYCPIMFIQLFLSLYLLPASIPYIECTVESYRHEKLGIVCALCFVHPNLLCECIKMNLTGSWLFLCY